MGRRAPFLAVLAAVLLVAAPAAGDPGSEKARIDGTIGELRTQIDRADRQAGVLTSQLSAATARVRAAERGLDAQRARLSVLEAQLAAAQGRVRVLERRLRVQSRQLETARRQYAVALGRLERRLRDIYTSDTPDALSFALGASSFSDVLDSLELVSRVGRQDHRIAATLERAASQLARAKAETRRNRMEAAREARSVAARTTEQREVRDRLVAGHHDLVVAQDAKAAALSSIREDRKDFVAEVESLQAESAALAARIAAAQAAAAQAAAARAAADASAPAADARASTPVTASTNGLSWPVSGVVTSGFGERWGRMHEGMDIAVPTGTPVHAAAAGTVIEAGWLGGYGNLVVIDHGDGLATAYGHNSSLAVAVGQQVAQGDVIASSGSTGHSTGPHVHFEVRLSGAPVDPTAYLG